MKCAAYFIVVAFTSSAIAAEVVSPAVSSRVLPSGGFELAVTVESTTDVGIAQQLLIPEARKVCAGQLFQFGRYSFDSAEQTGSAVTHVKVPRVTLRQEVECGPIAPASPTHSSYSWVPSDADNKLVAERTQEYLAHKDKDELTLAYDQFADSMKATTGFADWSKGVEGFLAKAGPVKLRKIRKISWVRDPPGVDPGFYAAVDYSGEFQNIKYQCGYVAWYRDAAGRLAIVREEEGFIDTTSGVPIAPAELGKDLAKIGCASG